MAKSTAKNTKDKSKELKVKTKAKEPTAKVSSKKAKTAVVKKTDASKKKAAVKKVVAAKVKPTSAKVIAAQKASHSYKSLLTVKDALKKMKGYGKRDLANFKKVIVAKREDILKQLQALKEQMMDSATGQYVNENSPYSLHMAEQGTDAQEREKLYLWAQRENKFLGYLDDALQRIEKGTYGICIDSLNDPDETPHLVPKERLFAVPHTQHCVACKMKKK